MWIDHDLAVGRKYPKVQKRHLGHPAAAGQLLFQYGAVFPCEFGAAASDIDESVPIFQEESIGCCVRWKPRQQAVCLCILPGYDPITINLEACAGWNEGVARVGGLHEK